MTNDEIQDLIAGAAFALEHVRYWRPEVCPDRPEGSDATIFTGTVHTGQAWRFVLIRWTENGMQRMDGTAMVDGTALRVSLPQMQAVCLKALEKEKSL